MSSGTIDLRNIISGSSNQGVWDFNNKKFPFIISETPPYEVEWTESFPTGHQEIESRISILAEQFLEDCKINNNNETI
jgi:hypothetical protein